MKYRIGQVIEYYHENDGRTKPKVKEGKIVAINGKFITVKLPRYRDSILLINLEIGASRIIRVVKDAE